ncbi:MAG: SDR family oxidoreductase [Chloroflexi bacterium]|nr:SDR family oxidoreductase [Chloroflexota bacterium]MCY3582132.1 SDR family oxidoreductase [Chloroflexota bacterium]MCY3716605.1 SDR family oxidoreductase [Chloroflexota bacterium]MDE2650979.1 SDR family oxidoreductase [Chloroflexota bacterium]MXX51253.1 SDR family oxidoreductase [Chloroflexota bacterium]
MQIELRGKVALVTGAAHRVGRAIAVELARQGADILAHYHSAGEELARDAEREIKSSGVAAHSVRADLAQPAEIESLFAALQDRFGRLDIVVNNAAIFQARDLLAVSLADWDMTMAVNLRAPFLVTQQAARLMARNALPGGVIINICDAGANGPWRQYPHHGISKSALWMLTQVSALSLGPAIRVNAIAPGPVMKTAGREISDEDWARVGMRSALQKTGTADDVARAVVYLCREDHITGALLQVNGGEHLR